MKKYVTLMLAIIGMASPNAVTYAQKNKRKKDDQPFVEQIQPLQKWSTASLNPGIGDDDDHANALGYFIGKRSRGFCFDSSMKKMVQQLDDSTFLLVHIDESNNSNLFTIKGMNISMFTSFSGYTSPIQKAYNRHTTISKDSKDTIRYYDIVHDKLIANIVRPFFRNGDTLFRIGYGGIGTLQTDAGNEYIGIVETNDLTNNKRAWSIVRIEKPTFQLTQRDSTKKILDFSKITFKRWQDVSASTIVASMELDPQQQPYAISSVDLQTNANGKLVSFNAYNKYTKANGVVIWNTEQKSLRFFPGLQKFQLTADGKFVYFDSSHIKVIDLATNTELKRKKLGGFLTTSFVDVQISPNGRFVWDDRQKHMFDLEKDKEYFLPAAPLAERKETMRNGPIFVDTYRTKYLQNTADSYGQTYACFSADGNFFGVVYDLKKYKLVGFEAKPAVYDENKEGSYKVRSILRRYVDVFILPK